MKTASSMIIDGHKRIDSMICEGDFLIPYLYVLDFVDFCLTNYVFMQILD